MSSHKTNTNPYIDKQDIQDTLDLLAEEGPEDKTPFDDGYFDALQDLEYANNTNGVSGVEFLLQQWEGYLSRTKEEHGYMNALYDFQEEINALIEERK